VVLLKMGKCTGYNICNFHNPAVCFILLKLSPIEVFELKALSNTVHLKMLLKTNTVDCVKKLLHKLSI